MGEKDRMPIEELSDHPFIADELISTPLSALDIEMFNEEMQCTTNQQIAHDNSAVSSQYSSMTDRFEDTEIKDTDVVLSTKSRDQVRYLLNQLVESPNFNSANFDLGNSAYFNKHFVPDQTILRMGSEFTTGLTSQGNNRHSSSQASQLQGTTTNPRDTAYSKQSLMYRISGGLSEMSGMVNGGLLSTDRTANDGVGGGNQPHATNKNNLEQVDDCSNEDNTQDHEELRAEDIDEQMFIFPDRNAPENNYQDPEDQAQSQKYAAAEH